jgi:hypothetical protein
VRLRAQAAGLAGCADALPFRRPKWQASRVLGFEPWTGPFILALVGGVLLATGSYVAGAICVALAVVVRWLFRIGVDRGDYG